VAFSRFQPNDALCRPIQKNRDAFTFSGNGTDQSKEWLRR
jgi:hypothetical protein